MTPRVGVFVCHCGLNISWTVDVPAVAEAMKDYPGVVVSKEYRYMCSDPGQNLIAETVKEHDLDCVIVAACSPNLHLRTYRRLAATIGLNPYQVEQANIREQCSWVHEGDKAIATLKAIDIVRATVESVVRDRPLATSTSPITRRAMVIGGGVAGMQAALDIADAGYPVIVIERAAQLGGRVAQMAGSYLNFDSPENLAGEMIGRVMHHSNIQVLTEADLVDVSGYIGNFEAVVAKRHPEGEGPIEDESFLFDVGAIIIATGYRTLPLARLPMYGGGDIPDVVDGLTFERIVAEGELRRPSDGRMPRSIVWVQCAGAREPEQEGSVAYCSKVCCMTTARQAIQYKQLVPEGQATVFYIDIRSAGLRYDEIVQQSMEQHEVLYLRGKVSRIFEQDGHAVVWGSDTLSNMAVEVEADMVVLQTPMVPNDGAEELGRIVRVGASADGFFAEAHPKLGPVETTTAGVFLAGTAQAPKDIPESIAQGSAAAGKTLSIFAQPSLVMEPTIAEVDTSICAGCGVCVPVCPYGARSLDERAGVARVNPALCQSCGACIAACPNKASKLVNATPDQVLAMVEAMMIEVFDV
jgi:heterodisulfide reductase subunit A